MHPKTLLSYSHKLTSRSTKAMQNTCNVQVELFKIQLLVNPRHRYASITDGCGVEPTHKIWAEVAFFTLYSYKYTLIFYLFEQTSTQLPRKTVAI